MQGQLTFSMIVTLGLILCGIGLLLDYITVRWLNEEYNRSLLAKAKALVTLTKQQAHKVVLDFADEFMPEFEAAVNPEYFQIWMADGSLIERSRSLAELDLNYDRTMVHGHKFSDLRLPDGRIGRQVQILFTPQIPDKSKRTPATLSAQRAVILVVARERINLRDNILIVHTVLATAILLLIALAAILVHIILRRGLIPLRGLKLQLESIGAANFDRRLQLGQPPLELQPLIEQFNGLLDRLEESYNRERRFSTDLAHELRTPVAELRNMAELAARWPEDKELTDGFYQEVLEASLQMQTMIQNLLALARCEKNRLELISEPLNPAAAIHTVWRRCKQQALSRGLCFTHELDEMLQIQTSRYEFEQILQNLFDNAVRYATAHSEIRARLRKVNDLFWFTLSNRTDNLSEGDLTHMFDRLWQKDKSRSSSNTGLGLSLVKAYAQSLKLQLAVEMDSNSIFTISLSGFVVPANQDT